MSANDVRPECQSGGDIGREFRGKKTLPEPIATMPSNS
jgi:hypothetical protein